MGFSWSPEISREQWQKGTDSTKIPRKNPEGHWFNRQTYRTDSTEEEEENNNKNEDDVTTDELSRTAESSEEDK